MAGGGTQTGDAVLLMGRFHTHRRDKLPKGAKSMSIFLHWVNIEYEGELKAGGHALSGYATSELLIPQVWFRPTVHVHLSCRRRRRRRRRHHLNEESLAQAHDFGNCDPRARPGSVIACSRSKIT